MRQSLKQKINLKNKPLLETPDNVVSPKDSKTGKAKLLSYYDMDAFPFIYIPKLKVGLVGIRSASHGMLSGLLAKFLKSNKDLRSDGRVILDGDGLGIYHPSIKWKDLKSHVSRGVEQKDLESNFEDRELFIQGRVWTDHKIVSFWAKRDGVIPHIKEVKAAIEFETGESVDDYMFDFLDSKHGPAPLEMDNKKELSDEEYKRLLAIQHLDPNAKNRLKDLGLIKASPVKEPEWKKEFRESIGYEASYPFKHSFTTELIDVEDEDTGETYKQEIFEPVQIVKFKTRSGVEYVWYARRNRFDDSAWEIAFGVVKDTEENGRINIDIGRTGTGDAIRVFSTVIEIINSFVEADENYEINGIYFESRDEKRTRLYLKYIIPKLEHFKLEGVDKSGSFSNIRLVRK